MTAAAAARKRHGEFDVLIFGELDQLAPGLHGRLFGQTLDLGKAGRSFGAKFAQLGGETDPIFHPRPFRELRHLALGGGKLGGNQSILFGEFRTDLGLGGKLPQRVHAAATAAASGTIAPGTAATMTISAGAAGAAAATAAEITGTGTGVAAARKPPERDLHFVFAREIAQLMHGGIQIFGGQFLDLGETLGVLGLEGRLQFGKIACRSGFLRARSFLVRISATNCEYDRV